MDENPYQSPTSPCTQDHSLEESMEKGETILVEIAARSFSIRIPILRLLLPMIGNFVVTNRRVFVLSSGKYDEFPFFRFFPAKSEKAMVERIARSLDITALQRESSWEFTIPEVRFAAARKKSIWKGAHLRVAGIDQNGNEVRRQVYRCGIKWETWKDVAAKIREIREGRIGL